MKEAWSEHIHTTASATSDGLPNRPIGWQLSTYLCTFCALKSRSAIDVSIAPGHTAFTRILLRAVSKAADFVSPTTPCLLALYAAAPAVPTSPEIEAMLTIAPPLPCLVICLISYLRQSHVPFRLIFTVRSKSTSDC